MKRIALVVLALLIAVHVSVPALGMAAPVPVLLAFASVLAWQCRLIWIAAGLRIEWRGAW